MKRLVSSLLSLVLIMTMAFTFSFTVKAEETAATTTKTGYTYAVRYSLGGSGDENSSFTGTVDELLSGGYLSVQSKKGTDTHGYYAAISGDTLVIDGLNYGDRVTFDAKGAVTVSPDNTGYTKYYVKGVRLAGADESVSKSSIEVTKNQDYVIAYGVGDVIPYTVKYVDADGNELLATQTYYAPKGEELYVSYRYIAGYVPNTYNYHTSKLEEETVFTFTYTPGSNTIETIEYVTTGDVTTGTDYVTIPGTTTYVTGEGGTTYVTVPGGTTYVTVPGAAAAGGGAGGAGNAAAAGGAAGGDAAAADGGAADGGAVIADDATPEAGPADVTEIDDGSTPLANEGASEFAFPIFAWVIVAVAAATVVTALVMMNKRKKAVASASDSKDEDPKKEA